MDEKVKFYGWINVIIAWLALFLIYAPGAFGFSMVIGPMAGALRMNATQATMGYSILVLVAGLASLLAAWFIHRIGIRWTLTIGAMAIVIGDLLLGTVVHTFPLYAIVFGVLDGIGLAMGTLLPIQTLISSWFIKNRGTAMSVTISGLGIGGLVWAVVVSKIMAVTANWPEVWLLLAFLALVGGILVVLFIRNKPSDLNQVPDGGQAGAIADTRRTFQTKVQWEARDVFRTPAFWLMVLAVAIVQGLAVPTMLATMGMDMLVINIPVATIGFIVGGLGILQLCGNFVVGPLADRLDNRYVLGAGLAIMAIGLWFFNILGPANISYAPILYVVLFGIGSGFNYVIAPIIFANYFGFKNFATFAAVAAVVVAIFSMIGPTMAGHIFDTTGSYSSAWLIIIGALVVGIISGLLALPPKPKNAES